MTGTQGVLIPAENVEDLMLRDDVIEAVAAGKFHVHPVAHIEEGIEILTGVARRARAMRAAISSPTPSSARVDERLREMADTLKQFE